MARTQADLVSAALAEVGALGAGQVPGASDNGYVTTRLASIPGDLVARRIVPSLDLGAIPDAWFADLVRIVAEHIRPGFGGQTSADTLKAAEARLRELARLDRSTAFGLARLALDRLEALGAATDAVDPVSVTGQIVPTLEDLSRRRIVTFADENAVPASALPHVALLMAWRVLPKAVEPALVAAAEEALRAASRLLRGDETPLVRAILDQLEIWGAARAAVDGTLVAARIGPALAELSARNVIYIASEDDVSDAAFGPVTRYVAAYLAPKLMGDVIAEAEDRLRTLQRINSGTGARLRVDCALLGRRRFC